MVAGETIKDLLASSEPDGDEDEQANRRIRLPAERRPEALGR